MKQSIKTVLFLILAMGTGTAAAFALSPGDLLVVFNREMEGSRQVAEHYAQKRGVPDANLVSVSVSVTERMTRSEYEKVLVPALRERVREHRRRGRSPALLLVYGIPIYLEAPDRGLRDKAFEAHLNAKIREFQELSLRLSAETDGLIGGDEAEKVHKNHAGDPYATEEILRIGKEAFNRGAAYLKQGTDEGIKTRIASQLFRLAGTSPVIKILFGTLADPETGNLEKLREQELIRWDAVLRRDLKERSFRGVTRDNADQAATLVRYLEGVLGELRFWSEVLEVFEAGEFAASVDSELSLILQDSYQTARWLPNPFHDQHSRFPSIEHIREAYIKVCRLDGPGPDDAKRLVDDAVAVEGKGLEGVFYIDARGLENNEKIGSYGWYDQHLLSLHEILKERSSMKVVLDRGPRLFGPGKCPDAALYCGWYSLRNYVDAFEWKQGAVGYHVASAEATTLRQKESRVWCKRMIEKGVTATLGPVAEPYLQSFPLPDHFFLILMQGKDPLIDVYYRTTPYLSWRQILIGDPMYTPFRKNPMITPPP